MAGKDLSMASEISPTVARPGLASTDSANRLPSPLSAPGQRLKAACRPPRRVAARASGADLAIAHGGIVDIQHIDLSCLGPRIC